MKEKRVNRGCPTCPLWGECAGGEASWHCKPDWESYLRMCDICGFDVEDRSGEAFCEVRVWWEGEIQKKTI